ncbi:ParA family protein [Corynebacterium testudinoris]|uniref:ParA family protein n=1 Tax=Corynebacterium testudinoris TaxID=136857 RepID=UPI001C8BC9C5|nr:ParA family protein [Corynebacterium testudinoris]MBX8995243.1 ParA family protein [Corynebacterium testudinoris]
MILTVANLKGGSGRTTTSLILALVASEYGTRVRVVDADPQGRAAKAVKYAIAEDDPLPFPADPIPIYESSAEKYAPIDRILNSSSDYDLTIIDAPSRSPATTRILSTVSDFVVVSAFPSFPDLKPTLATVKSVVGPYAVLLNRIGRAITLEAEFLFHIKENNAIIFDTAIPDVETFKKAFEGRMGGNFHGYELVFEEIQEMLRSRIDVAWGTTHKPKSTTVPS